MKSFIRKIWLLWLSLLCGVWIFSFITKAVEIKTTPVNWVAQHTTVLHSLYLWNGTSDMTWAWFRVVSWRDNLHILNWMALWTGYAADWSLILVWGWDGNKVKNGSNNVGIWWWYYNELDWDNSSIWWWYQNTANWLSVVVWWRNNTADDGVVLGWTNGRSVGGVLLWWKNNSWMENSMVLWINAEWEKWSFVWNTNASAIWKASENSARINASNWLLIWTNTPVNEVKLVVNGAIKIWNSNLGTAWEIKLAAGAGEWCISASDGSVNFALGGASNLNGLCWRNWGCEYLWVYIENWKTMTVYKNFYAIKWQWGCTPMTITCNNWTMSSYSGYPYCFEIDTSNPVYKWGTS